MNTSIFERFRKKHGLSQSALGKALGVGQNAISQYESGVRAPHIEVAWAFKRFAKAKGESISLDDIYQDPDSISPPKDRRQTPSTAASQKTGEAGGAPMARKPRKTAGSGEVVEQAA